MSGVYIPDMEKPKCCFLCPLSYAISPAKTGYCRLLFEENEAVEGGQMWRTISDVTKLADFCPLVAVPPHGRLIDADALYEQTAEWEAQALLKVGDCTNDNDEDIAAKIYEAFERRKWSAILQERSAFKHDVADAPTIIEAEGKE